MQNFFRNNPLNKGMPNLSSPSEHNRNLNNLAKTMNNMQNVKQDQQRYNQTVNNFASQLKDLSNDPTKKAYVLGHLSRISGQISQQDYNEILSNVKSSSKYEKDNIKEEPKPENKTEPISDQESLIDDMRRLEREMNRRNI